MIINMDFDYVSLATVFTVALVLLLPFSVIATMSILVSTETMQDQGRVFVFLFGFSFTVIHESQDCRGRGRAFP